MSGDQLHRRPSLGPALLGIFLIAMFMGPGPGIRLSNPDPGDPAATFTLVGVPVVYAWSLLWYAVQVTVVLVAFFRVWSRRED